MVYLVAASNEPSTPAGNNFLETLWVAIPLGRIPLTFLTAYLPGGGGWWWLLRAVLVSSVGLLVASFIAAAGSTITIPAIPACSAHPRTVFQSGCCC